VIVALAAAALLAQDPAPPTVRVGDLGRGIVVDGVLDETAWSTAEPIETLTQPEPEEGAPASLRPRRHLARLQADASGSTCRSTRTGRSTRVGGKSLLIFDF